MTPNNLSQWKSIFRVPLLLLCLLLINGCAGKNNVTPPQHPASATDVTLKKERENKEDKPEEQAKEKKQERKKEKKVPPTQRPYVIEGQKYYPIPSAEGYEEIGLASWYGDPFHGRKTANGETYDMYGETAAHKTLPMGTVLLVKNLVNGKTATVRINDRGPFVDGRIIDLSYTTAKQLGIYRRGTEKVQIVALCAAGQEQKQEQQESYEDIIGALAEEGTEKISDKRKDIEEQEEGGLPVLVAHSKKKQIESSEPAERVTGPLCAVILPDGKKQRIRQDFDKGNFYIQVGSFEKKARARKLARVFAAQGHNVVIQEFAAAGTHLFRVLVFSSTSLKAAKKHKEKLKEQGYEHAFVIARDNPPKKRKKATGTGRESKGAREKIAVN